MRSINLLNRDDVAVVLIDLQKGYCDPTSDCATKLGWDVSNADALCHRVAAWLPDLRKFLPADRILWMTMEETAETIAPNMHYVPAIGEELCVRGTEGHKFHIVSPADGEPVFQKFHMSAFHCDEFAQYLKDKNIKQLVFIGVLGSRCVNASVISASTNKYECIMLEDLVGGPVGKKFENELKTHWDVTAFFYAMTMSAKNFLSALTGTLKTTDLTTKAQPSNF